jgi:threonine synthase
MDVGDPSNLARIRYLYGDSVRALRRDVVGQRVTDRATRELIRRIWEDRGYLMDPHSAVGMVALEQELARRPRALGVVLATAHPAKFSEIVEPVIGESVPIPPELARCLDAERVVIPMEPRQEELQELLRPPPDKPKGATPAR